MSRFVRMSRVMALTLAFSLAALPAAAGTWYCDPVNGSMSGDGSQGNPWAALADVVAANKIESQKPASYPYVEGAPLAARNAGAPIKAGDTILLLTGDHGEVYLTGYFNASMITIEAAPGQTPVLQQWLAYGGMNWTFRGVTVSREPYGTPDGSVGMEFEGHSWHGPMSDVLVEDCTFYSVADGSAWTRADWQAYASGGFGFNGKRCTVRNNTFRYTTQAIGVAGEDILVEGNLVEHIGHDGIRAGGDRITLQYNTMRYFYDMDDNHDDGIQFYTSGSDPMVGCVLRGNIIDALPRGHAIETTTPAGIGCFDGPYVGWVVENNVVLINQFHGITLDAAQNCRIVNNTTIGVGISLLGDDSFGCTVRNNLVSSFNLMGTDHTTDHNLVVVDTQRDIFFVDYANGDLSLKATSPAIDAGIATDAPIIDIDGTPRPQGAAHDLGAYEYGAVTPGDANGDGDVDLDDFVILKTNFGRNGATHAQGDFDGDGDVDLDDFVILKTNFGS